MKDRQVVIITGLSGSGKSTAIRSLEDLGFFCVDNLPVTLMPTFLELCFQSSQQISRVALVIDLREREFFEFYPQVFKTLRDQGFKLEILFLEASDKALIQRFSETRRPHPLATKENLLEGIWLERERMMGLKTLADKVIDTSEWNVHQLKNFMKNYFQEISLCKRMSINLLSFGFKYGLPLEADIVIDVRFLPNPFFEGGLKGLTGEDEKVLSYILNKTESIIFLEKFKDMLDFLLPLYESEGKSYLIIAFGCTGGKHRSVAITEEVGKRIARDKYNVSISHRDLGKE